ncbi:MAG: monofunctional biosynthetic peptidoglycan transglycosylase [Steroidobacteraceae bacterium]
MRRWTELARWRGVAVTVAGAGAILFLLAVVPVLAMRWIDPWTSAFMIEARIAAIGDAQPYRTRYQWVDLEHIAPQAAVAVIAAEDQQFPFHWGFDFQSIRKAIRANERGRRLRGASTISQQVAKNLFLWKGQSYLRKGLEAWITLLIEWSWPKERILEVYLNIAEFGRGVYGVQAAAQQFFHKSAARLTRREAALLAAVLPNPRILRADAPSPYIESRSAYILGQMRALGGPAYLSVVENEDLPGAALPGSRPGR